MSSQMFPDPRRIVTGHNTEGKAVVVADSTIQCVPTPVKCNFAVLYETHQFPDSLDEWVDPAKDATLDLSNSKGVVLRVVDIAPKTETVSSKNSLTEEKKHKVQHNINVFLSRCSIAPSPSTLVFSTAVKSPGRSFPVYYLWPYLLVRLC